MITKANIHEIREGVAEFSQRAGISQAEAACELCLVLAIALSNVEAGMSADAAVEAAVEGFTERWGEVFEE